jgi:7,8-dihydroneopterin aldolase/epimerase/oxygenase
MKSRHFIRLHNAVFYGYHGNHHEERNLGGKFHVDAELETDFTAAAVHDKLGETVDYEYIYSLIQEALTQDKFHLIESIAKRLADKILETVPMVVSVRIRVRKPGAPIKGVIDHVEVEVYEVR